MRVGIAIPQNIDNDRYDPERLRDYLAEVERLGYDSVWAAEMHGTPMLDPLALLAFAAAVTRRVRLGVAVVLTSLRPPYQLAKDIATLDRLSGGRIDLGVGLGANPALYSRYGLPTEHRLHRYVSGLQLTRRLWTEDHITTNDGLWPMSDVTLAPKPVQRPHPPILFGARTGPALERAVRLGDGWIGAATWPLAELGPAVAELRDLLDKHRRDPATFSLCRKVFVHLDDDPAAARKAVADYFARLGRPNIFEPLAVYGTPQSCADQLAQLCSVGLDQLILNPIDDNPEQAQRLAAEVVPAVCDTDNAETDPARKGRTP